MSTNARMMIGSYLDDASTVQSGAVPIVASSAVSTLPATNLINTLPSLKWRSNSGLTAASIVSLALDIGSAVNRSSSAFCLYNHNLTSGGSWRLKAYNGQSARDADSDGSGTTGVGYDSGWVGVTEAPTIGYGTGGYSTYGYGGYGLKGWLRYRYIAHFMAPVTKRWWKLFLKDSTPESGYFEAGRLMLCNYFEPSVNFEWGYGIEWVDPSIQIRTRGGALRSEFQTPFRRVSASFTGLSAHDVDWMLEIMRLIGRRGDVLWVAYPDEDTDMARRNILSGRLTEWSPAVRQVDGYQVNFSLEESI